MESIGAIVERVIDRMPLARHLVKREVVVERETGDVSPLLARRIPTQRFLRRPPANDNGERPVKTWGE